MEQEKSPERWSPASDAGAAVVVVNAVVAGVGGLYGATGSIAVTLVAAGLSVALGLVVLRRRT
ncbi:hypothetical protein ACQPZF_41620 [Actinosynnema sp. CS-041913]|uniref:hypothetical protein n=1 Tax=Actinosynnema sp. CS-041913 TaxID=3239917 RepID=UPI003D8E3071